MMVHVSLATILRVASTIINQAPLISDAADINFFKLIRLLMPPVLWMQIPDHMRGRHMQLIILL